ncbi:MAG: DUF1801 domain-containing protein [Actinobacteria bacterium]|nr:DUF1801 domain-containing protein [Actinomycetota bacterium]
MNRRPGRGGRRSARHGVSESHVAREENLMAGPSKKAAADAAALQDKIAEMASPDREIAERVHAIVMAAAPDLAPKLWYGQPAWAKDGKVVCFFRSGQVDKERYSTFGFSAEANLDDDTGIWPTSYALTELTDAGEQQLTRLVASSVS